jgi:hypothetical protein
MRELGQPIHFEARQLGANLTAIRKHWSGGVEHVSAKDIQAVWDYRKAGLTVKQARDNLEKWTKTRGYHSTLPEMGGGEIAAIGQRREAIRKRFHAFLEEVSRYPAYEGGALTWQRPRARIEADGRTIVVVRKEDVTWPDRGYGKSSRWPESKTVSYTSYLLRKYPPSAEEIKRFHLYDSQYPSEMLGMFTEKQISHDARGKWADEVVDKLLGRKAGCKGDVVDPWRYKAEWEERMNREQGVLRPDDRWVTKAVLRHQRKGQRSVAPRLSR